MAALRLAMPPTNPSIKEHQRPAFGAEADSYCQEFGTAVARSVINRVRTPHGPVLYLNGQVGPVVLGAEVGDRHPLWALPATRPQQFR